MEQNRPSLSDNYTQPTTTNPILEGLEGSSSKLEIKPQGTESTLQGTKENQVILKLNLKQLKQQKLLNMVRDRNLTKHLNMLNIEMLVQVSRIQRWNIWI